MLSHQPQTVITLTLQQKDQRFPVQYQWGTHQPKEEEIIGKIIVREQSSHHLRHTQDSQKYREVFKEEESD